VNLTLFASIPLAVRLCAHVVASALQHSSGHECVVRRLVTQCTRM
jgi:hypothetical protein